MMCPVSRYPVPLSGVADHASETIWPGARPLHLLPALRGVRSDRETGKRSSASAAADRRAASQKKKKKTNRCRTGQQDAAEQVREPSTSVPLDHTRKRVGYDEPIGERRYDVESGRTGTRTITEAGK